MSKPIIFCADGTWNGPPEETKVSALDGDDAHGEVKHGDVTNVLKLYANLAGRVTAETLALQNEQEKVLLDAAGRVQQAAKYIHGVGDSRNPLLRFFGGTFGMGVIDRIIRGYTYLSRTYEPGDEIHLVGFSRGAYTVRALAGMIAQVGLLDPTKYDPTNKRAAYRLAVAAWCTAKRMSFAGGHLSKVGNAMLTVIEGLAAGTLPPGIFVEDVQIKSVAVWDTVGALGIPKYTDGDGRLDLLRFADETLSAKVRYGFHAMAIDELRQDFPVARWGARPGVEEVWFVGAHSDVGGGYAANECYLSDIALEWMMAKLKQGNVGVEFDSPFTHIPMGKVLGGECHTPWKTPPFNVLQSRPREVKPGDVLHPSVKQCWTSAAPSYRPGAMAAFAATGLTGLRYDPPL